MPRRRFTLLLMALALALGLFLVRTHRITPAAADDSQAQPNLVHAQLNPPHFPISQLFTPYTPPTPATVLWNPANPTQLPPQSPVRSVPYELKNQSAPTYSAPPNTDPLTY